MKQKKAIDTPQAPPGAEGPIKLVLPEIKAVEHDALSKADFQRFTQLIYKITGINMNESKYELLYARLSGRIRALNLRNFSEYYDHVVNDASGEEISHMVDQVTTNKTEFFRESRHFEHLAQTAIPEFLQRPGNRPFRVWCAAAATGEEPWTLAMTCMEALDGQRPFKVVATDISMKALTRAAAGQYDDERIVGVPKDLLHRYFEPQAMPKGRVWKVRPELRSCVAFARLNLMMAAFPFEQPFDVIFCRNVMIYFDRGTQETLVNKLAGKLNPRGYLYTGLSESLLAIKHPLKAVAPSIYQKP